MTYIKCNNLTTLIRRGSLLLRDKRRVKDTLRTNLKPILYIIYVVNSVVVVIMII